MHYTFINDGELQSKRFKLGFLIVASFIISVAGFLENDLLYALTNLGFSVVGLFIDPLIPLCLNIATSPMSLGTSAIISIGLRCLVTLPALYIYTKGKQNGIRAKDFWFLFAAAFIIFFSFMFGTDARLTTAILQIMTLMCCVVASNVYLKDRNLLVVSAFVLAGVYMALAVTLQIQTDAAVTLWGVRLTYNGSVRALATVLAFPIFVFLAKIILPRENRLGAGKMCLLLVGLAIMVTLLIATYSRGVLIAIIVAAAYLILSQFRRLTAKQLGLYLVVFAAAAYLVLTADINTEYMFADVSDAGGRLDIWAFFFEKLSEKGLTGLLFGFGPGDILRISAGTEYDGYYSHSVLLDYVFSYGLAGLCFLVYMLARVFTAAIRSKNAMFVGLFILTVVLYATHGNSASFEFHILLGLTFSLSMSQIRKNEALHA